MGMISRFPFVATVTFSIFLAMAGTALAFF